MLHPSWCFCLVLTLCHTRYQIRHSLTWNEELKKWDEIDIGVYPNGLTWKNMFTVRWFWVYVCSWVPTYQVYYCLISNSPKVQGMSKVCTRRLVLWFFSGWCLNGEFITSWQTACVSGLAVKDSELMTNCRGRIWWFMLI